VRTHEISRRRDVRSTIRVGALAVALVSSILLLGTTHPARADARWAPAAKAAIHPGTMMFTRGAQCTGNFVFADARGRTYLGYAAHCAGTGTSTQTDGCGTPSVPLGTRVRFARDASAVSDGTTVGHGRLAYSSWRTMRRLHTRSANACEYNDFALVRVDRADEGLVNPSVPFWGGPVGLAHRGTAQGDRVYAYGNSSLRGGATALAPRTGVSLGDASGGWTRTVYTVTPGIPGDSGSGYLDPHGRAVGVLATIAFAPLAGSNGVNDLAHELAFAQRHSGIAGLHLVRGTEPFTG
jgi:hypothetical protein